MFTYVLTVCVCHVFMNKFDNETGSLRRMTTTVARTFQSVGPPTISVSSGVEIEVIESRPGGWYCVKHDDQIGWIPAYAISWPENNDGIDRLVQAKLECI